MTQNIDSLSCMPSWEVALGFALGSTIVLGIILLIIIKTENLNKTKVENGS